MADLKPGMKVVDLGAGDGRIVFEASKVKGVESHGVELNPVLAFFGKLKFRKHKNIKFFHENMWKMDLSKYDRIFLFCLRKEMKKFEERLKKELKPGALVVSNIFQFSNWKPVKSRDNIFVYKVD